jgi:hypothetical protein
MCNEGLPKLNCCSDIVRMIKLLKGRNSRQLLSEFLSENSKENECFVDLSLMKRENKFKVFPVLAMKLYRGVCYIAPLILNFGPR